MYASQSLWNQSTNTMKVLVVDDDRIARIKIDRALKASGLECDITEAVDVGSAQEMVGQQEFDIGLFDFRLPDGDALDLLEHLAQHRQLELPVIVLTGIEDEKTAPEVLSSGAQDYLLKGEFDSALLERAIRYAVERKHAENLRRKLMHSDRLVALGQMAAGVVHEINNPAAFVRANLQFIQQSVDETADSRMRLGEMVDDVRELVSESLEGIDRISSVVRDLGAFARRRSQPVEMVDFNDIVRQACNLTAHEIQHHAELRCELSAEMPAIAADRDKLIQVVTNLLLNAMHAVKEVDGALIVVQTRIEGMEVVLEVEDNGYGIPEHQRERIFEPFFTTKSAREGTGLGLAICDQIIDVHGGQIELQVEDRTCFVVRIPRDTGLKTGGYIEDLIRSPNGADDESAQGKDTDGDAGGTRVLLIDDEPMVLRACRRYLSSRYEVETANGGKQALELLSEDDGFDAIVCDVMLPEMDARMLFGELERENPALTARLIFLTGGIFDPGTREFLDSLDNPVLEKPIDFEGLIEVIEATSRR